MKKIYFFAITAMLLSETIEPEKALTDTIILSDSMTNPESCSGICAGGRTVNGGFFDSDGWHQSDYDAQVVYDLGPGGVDCGIMEVDLKNFNPFDAIHESSENEYHFIFRLDENPAGTRCDKVEPNASSISPLALRRDLSGDNKDKSLRLDAWADCWGGRNTYTTPEIEWDSTKTYHIILTWNSINASLSIIENGTQLASSTVNLWWTPGTSDPTMNLRYLFIGKDNYDAGQPMQGPIWFNLTVMSVDCPEDQPICGDKCPNEFCTECPSGCSACTNYCGDNICSGEETCITCPEDCGQCIENDELIEFTEQEAVETPVEIELPEGTEHFEEKSDVDSGTISNGGGGGCSCIIYH